MDEAQTDPLSAARDERKRLLDRITWWDSHRYSALFPIAVVCFGAGYGVGYLLRQLVGAPERTEVICALAALFGVGRFVDQYFSMSHLDRVDARIAKLERERERATKR
ncbi:MAG: hypothetical protein U0326_05210 [Polyangiales bacterium]